MLRFVALHESASGTLRRPPMSATRPLSPEQTPTVYGTRLVEDAFGPYQRACSSR